MTFKTKQSALKEARKALGPSAVEGVDFQLRNTGAGWEQEPMPAANEPAKAARAKKAAPVKAPVPKAAKAKPAKQSTPVGTRHADASPAQTKTQMLVSMMSAPGGATSAEMEKAAGWAPHSVRGLIGTLKKRGIHVQSTKLKGEPTIYKIPTERSRPSATAESVGDVI